MLGGGEGLQGGLYPDEDFVQRILSDDDENVDGRKRRRKRKTSLGSLKVEGSCHFFLLKKNNSLDIVSIDLCKGYRDGPEEEQQILHEKEEDGGGDREKREGKKAGGKEVSRLQARRK